MKIDHPALSQIPALRRLWQEAFADDDAFLDRFFDTAFSPRRCRILQEENQIAAALYWFDCRCYGTPMAYLYAIATDRAFRRRGFCHRLLEDTHALLRERGYGGSILVPASPSLADLYESMGYRHFGGMDTIAANAGVPIALEEISHEAYCASRSSYLPKGSVAQELSFLADSAQFYRGADFLLAAAEQNSAFIGLELLGNTAASPGILAALDKKEGHFRISGNTPFAMYHSLNDTPAPAYFAFAFD